MSQLPTTAESGNGEQERERERYRDGDGDQVANEALSSRRQGAANSGFESRCGGRDQSPRKATIIFLKVVIMSRLWPERSDWAFAAAAAALGLSAKFTTCC